MFSLPLIASGLTVLDRFSAPLERHAKPLLRTAMVSVSMLLAAVPAMAAQDAGGFECRYDGNQQEMNACAVRDYRAADVALNLKYQAVMSALPAGERMALRKEQRAWLQRRDPECKAEAKPSEGGSMWPLEYFGCMRAATERRTKELDQPKIAR